MTSPKETQLPCLLIVSSLFWQIILFDMHMYIVAMFAKLQLKTWFDLIRPLVPDVLCA